MSTARNDFPSDRYPWFAVGGLHWIATVALLT